MSTMTPGRIGMILTLIFVMAACVIIGIIGITTKHYAYLALLPFGLFGGITGFIYGLRGEPGLTDSPHGPEGTFFNLPGWVIAVDALLLIGGIVAIVLAR